MAYIREYLFSRGGGGGGGGGGWTVHFMLGVASKFDG